jgi:hypothetical protein
MTLEPTKLSIDGVGEPAAARLLALWPDSMMSISPLRGHACGLTPSIHAAGHRPTPSAGCAMRISTMPYCTCTLLKESILPEVKTLLPTVWLRAWIASARVAVSNGTLTMDRLFGL